MENDRTPIQKIPEDDLKFVRDKFPNVRIEQSFTPAVEPPHFKSDVSVDEIHNEYRDTSKDFRDVPFTHVSADGRPVTFLNGQEITKPTLLPKQGTIFQA